MKSLALILCLSFALTFFACERKEKIPSEINFITSYETALASAQKSGKNMIVDFYTDWCRWCDSLDANTYSDSLVISLLSDNIFVKINAEVDTALADQFGVSGYPTIVIAKSNGEEIDRAHRVL
jgi:thiol:disulfide interchange protein